MEPNKEHLRLWVEDLESGQYKQTRDVMCRFDDDGSASYCCLGRLGEVAIANGVDVNRHRDGNVQGYGGNGHTATVVSVIGRWLGVDSDELITYSKMNDGICSRRGRAFRSSFDEIAARIREDFDLGPRDG